MTPSWDGKERRSASEFEREVISFMARVDQRNQDRDLQSVIRDEACAKLDAKVEERITSLESSREYAKGVIKAVAVGIPAFGSVAWFVYEFSSVLKKLKGGG